MQVGGFFTIKYDIILIIVDYLLFYNQKILTLVEKASVGFLYL